MPAVDDVTSTVMVHVLFAAIDPPESTMLPPPAVAVSVPPQVFVVESGELFVIAAGYVSVKATPVSAVPVLGLVSVNVSVEVPPDAIGSGAKFLAMSGAATTRIVFKLVLFVSSLSLIKLLESTVAVFANDPAAVGVTVNVTLNDAPTGSVTAPPLATHDRLVPIIEQAIVPVGVVPPGVTVSAPCG